MLRLDDLASLLAGHEALGRLTDAVGKVGFHGVTVAKAPRTPAAPV
jgi:hypothetical protein